MTTPAPTTSASTSKTKQAPEYPIVGRLLAYGPQAAEAVLVYEAPDGSLVVDRDKYTESHG